MLVHATKGHDIEKCENCAENLKIHHKLSQAMKEAGKRKRKMRNRDARESHRDNHFHEKSGRIHNNEWEQEKEVSSLSDHLVDVHVNMQVLSFHLVE